MSKPKGGGGGSKRQGGDVVNLDRYLSLPDQNKKKPGLIGDWAVQVARGVVKCTICSVPFNECTVTFKKGELDLQRHSKTDKHQNRSLLPRKDSLQPKLNDLIQNKAVDKAKEEAKELEIGLVSFFANHNIPNSSHTAECLVSLMKEKIPDSEIIKKVQLSREKARYLTIHGVGAYYEESVVEKLRNCDAFSVSIDESEVNHRSELEIQVKVSSKDGVESLHYACVDLEAGDAETIVETILDKFNDDKIDYKSKLINVGMDGCSTMMGAKSGVITRLMKEVDQLRSDGSCNAHHLSNTQQHATEVFGGDVKNALVDTYYDLGGAAGKGLKKQKEFKRICREECGFEPSPILRFVKTRFRTLRTCIKPILENFLGLFKYYSSLKKPTKRQKRLIKFYVDRCDLTRIRLKFLYAANRDFCTDIDFFEEKAAHVHNTGKRLEDILMKQYRKIVKETEITKLDEEDNIVRKSRKELVNMDLEKVKILPNKEIFVGTEVAKELKALDMTPDSPQVAWLFEAVKKFHLEALKYLQKYFRKAMTSSVISNLSALDPNAVMQNNFSVSRKLKSLCTQYSKVVDNIQPVEGMDDIQTEIDAYMEDDDVKNLPKDKGLERYWMDVNSLTTGEENWKRYPLLPRFVFAMMTRYDANSEVERTFSKMNLIHQNKARNSMQQDSLNAHLHIRGGIENDLAKRKCEKCNNKSAPHCHCSLVIMSDELKAKCKKANSKYLESKEMRKESKEEFEQKNVEKRNNVVEKEKKRIEKLKVDLHKKSQFCEANLFIPIYCDNEVVEDEDNSEEKKVKRKATKENNNEKDKSAKKARK